MGLAGGESCLVRCQVGHQCGNLFGFANAAHGLSGHKGGAYRIHRESIVLGLRGNALAQ